MILAVTLAAFILILGMLHLFCNNPNK